MSAGCPGTHYDISKDDGREQVPLSKDVLLLSLVVQITVLCSPNDIFY